MKLNDAIELGKQGRWEVAQVRLSPGNLNQWFVMLLDIEHKSFILANDDDQTIATDDINRLVELTRAIGLKKITVFL